MAQQIPHVSVVPGAGAAWKSPALDLEIALSRVGGDFELLQEIAQLFLDDAERMLADIRNSVQARDAKALDRSAHTLKGCVSNFGALRLYEAAFTLEQAGRGNQLAHIEAGFTVLETEIRRLQSELRALTSERTPAR